MTTPVTLQGLSPAHAAARDIARSNSTHLGVRGTLVINEAVVVSASLASADVLLRAVHALNPSDSTTMSDRELTVHPHPKHSLVTPT